jgi:hypothetical protein
MNDDIDEIEQRRFDRLEHRARLRAEIAEGERDVERRRMARPFDPDEWMADRAAAERTVERAAEERQRALEKLERMEATADQRAVGGERRMYEQYARTVTDWAHRLKHVTNEAARVDQLASVAENLVTLIGHHAAAERALADRVEQLEARLDRLEARVDDLETQS